MKICYCITAYNEATLLSRIIARLQHESSLFLIHIDKRVDDSEFKKKIYNKNAFFVKKSERISSVWGDISTSMAILKLLRMGIELIKNEEAYYVVMSGCDYPLKTPDYIYNYFESKYPVDFIHYLPIEKCSGKLKKQILSHVNHYWLSVGEKLKLEIAPFKFIRPRCITGKDGTFKTLIKVCGCLPKALCLWCTPRKYPSNLKLATAETWMQLTDKTVKEMISYIDSHPDVMRYHSLVGLPEETFLQSVILTMDTGREIRDFLIYLNRNRLGKEHDLNLTLEDKSDIKVVISHPDFLFARKTSVLNIGLLDYIDSKMKL